jgi:hypothetical protein
VTTLVNTSNKGPSGKKKGRSKKAHVLAASVEQATQNFLEKGEQIAKESQDLKEELVAAVEDVRKQGRQNNGDMEGVYCVPMVDFLFSICEYLLKGVLFFSLYLQLNFLMLARISCINRDFLFVLQYHRYKHCMSAMT